MAMTGEIKRVESSNVQYLLSLGGSLSFIGAQILAAEYFNLTGEKMIPWYIAAATIYITGRIADEISTIRIVESYSNANSRGVSTIEIWEKNKYLPELPTKKDILSYRKMSFNILGGIQGVIFPPTGFLLGALSFYAAVHNNGLRKIILDDIDATARGGRKS